MISGYVCVRNGRELDYCFEEAISSLLPVCEEVVVCDSDSTDGTTAAVCEWMSREPKIRLINWPWMNPHHNLDWWTDWLNFARGHLRFPVQLTLDADEVLDPLSYPVVREIAVRGQTAWCRRINYWRDAQHVAPAGTVCAELVARIGPSQHWMTSDGPVVHVPNIRTYAIELNPIPLIHHYGFIRKPEAFMRKSEIVQRAFFGSVDERIERNARDLGDWRKGDYFGRPLPSAPVPHPEMMHGWLRERGYIA